MEDERKRTALMILWTYFQWTLNDLLGIQERAREREKVEKKSRESPLGGLFRSNLFWVC